MYHPKVSKRNVWQIGWSKNVKITKQDIHSNHEKLLLKQIMSITFTFNSSESKLPYAPKDCTTHQA